MSYPPHERTVPEPPQTPPPGSLAAKKGSGTGKLPLIVGASVLGLGCISALVIVTASPGGSSSGGSGQPVASADPGLDRNGTCALEVVSEADLLSRGDSGLDQLRNAIGSQSVQFRLALATHAVMSQEIAKAGVSEALPAVMAQAKSLCARQGDPLLTAGQVGSLKRVAPPTDAAILSIIDLFA
jgi:hypothetical protein